MSNKPLTGRKVAVIVEHKFIPEEIAAYRDCFTLLGASVDFISRLYYGDYKPGSPYWRQAVFYSDVDPTDMEPWQSPELCRMNDDMDPTKINLDEYDALIQSANYTSVRLRYTEVTDAADARSFVQSAPMVRLFAEAMKRKDLVKGALCHGLWTLTPHPELLKGRRVTCHTVVMADILNCGAEVVFEENGDGKRTPARVVADGDLVTGFSKHEVLPFIDAIAAGIIARRGAA
ncbi:MAG: DJ-1/PfpI family protein [Magnetococcales bacterium]|nr:DJ-1/PfpI family protein [Magnetococcales bacterium]